jgi:hypothetical protein
MVDAFTFDNGAPRKFASRKDMYDHMIENGHVIEEGDDAALFLAHAKKKAKDNDKAAAVVARLEA